MKILIFDVMLNEQYIHTFKYKYNPLFPIEEEELRKVCGRKVADIEREEIQDFVLGYESECYHKEMVLSP